MSSANLNISVVEKRMFSTSEAADYTGILKKYFKTTCPVQLIELRPGTVIYDQRYLDVWIEGIKAGAEATTQDDILGKL